MEVTLRDIHAALGGPRIFSVGLSDENPDCLVEQAVNLALDEAMVEAEQRLLARFGVVSLGEIPRAVAASRQSCEDVSGRGAA